ncbi:MAG: hypothetical protein LAP40_18170 [Acidobacteriia bacterium]|nr:hypothetical protein [Terriglobia bacterium]
MLDVRLRLDFARSYLAEIQRDVQAGAIPAPDGDFAYGNAIRADREALAEYARVLRIFTDLTLHGRLPEDNEEPPPRAQQAGGGS